MNPFVLAAVCAALAVVSTFVLKFVSKAVPIVLMGLPVIWCGLATVMVVAVLVGVNTPALLIGVAGTLAALAGGYVGHKLANRFFTESLLG